MVWKAGESGNPGGSVREKKFLAALERAVVQDDGKRLRAAAEKLLDLAAEGESWAIAQLADRLDGKPTQAVDVAVRRQADELPDADLLDIARSGSDRTAQAQGGAQKPASVH